MINEVKSKPNIVFILSDDHGAWALGCYGNQEIMTPNIDYLAATGARFENFFCTSPVCSPARASIITGKMPSQHGILDWLRVGNIGTDSIEYLEGQIAYTDILAQNGYTCGISGKWHLGNSLKPQKSFSHWFVHQKGGSSYTNAPMIRDGKPVNIPGYLTDAITDDALEFIDENATKDSPFYLSIHYTAPHAPWINEHPKDIVNSYADCPFDSCPQEPEHPFRLASTEPTVRNEDVKENLKGYFAAVTAMDNNIGRILNKLDSLGIKENTLVCYFGDNGFNCGHHGIWGKGNGTYPPNMYDTSIRIPAIMNHPGHIQYGIVSDVMLSGYDIMPTLLNYVGLDNPELARLPGKSFLPLLLGNKNNIHERIVVYDEYGPTRMIRTKEWKYIHRYPYGPHELFNLVNDSDEKINLIDNKDIQEIVVILKSQLDQWFVQYTDPKYDGCHEPVKGKGQISLVGPEGKGELAFYQDMEIGKFFMG